MGYLKVKEVIMGDSLDANGNAVPGERYELKACSPGSVVYSNYRFKWRTYTTFHVVYHSDYTGKAKFRITNSIDRYYERNVVQGDNEFFWTFNTYNLMPETKWYYLAVAVYVPKDGEYHFETFCADKFLTSEAPQTPPHIVITNVDVAPNPALTTQTIEVVVYLKNEGGTAGTAHVVTRVYKNGSVVREITKTFTLEEYGTHVDYTDRFTLPAGEYTVEVTVTETGSSKSVSLSVSDTPNPKFWVENNVKQAWLEYGDEKIYENQTLNIKKGEKFYAKAEIINYGVKGRIYFYVLDKNKQTYLANASAEPDPGYAWIASLSFRANEDMDLEFHTGYMEGDNFVVTDRAGCSGSGFLGVGGKNILEVEHDLLCKNKGGATNAKSEI